jgi:hypothetical protein
MAILELPKIAAAPSASYDQSLLTEKRHKMRPTWPHQPSFFSTNKFFLGPDKSLSLQDEHCRGYDVPLSKCPPSLEYFVAHKDDHETK